ncbi:hypothetical protein COX03_02255 [Candidatus Woesebacteria bacterium CG22_combo_CG10-13_8_21_14_all_39_10]|uniref:N-acetyltransferase domain-containing protein n=2 Tax=Candidatus Woeseibacteriota TaxID=1752722 RepID=A0A2H0BIU6_9BACT|nr:MAG: hypothetical protein COX03_02255 [Candidatus Woesebacteria bacterium CG22_combo_CG10-13_8_21_14_all_39_10]PIZ50129.1 MAG: hypothetical protein COY29_00385 [Candidatus Woesebacteria bacterium CG_4_10_14_0_2_um_filter_39_14]
MIEAFNEPRRIDRVLDHLSVTVVFEPRAILSPDTQSTLSREVMQVVRHTSGRSDIDEEEIVPYLFGEAGRGKVLAFIKDGDQVKAFAAGQFLNDGVRPLQFDGGTVFHVSTVHTVPGLVVDGGITLMKEIYDCLPSKPSHISAFTQSPRVYEYVKFLARGRVFPNPVGDSPENLATVYAQIVDFLGFKGEVDGGVFRRKIKGSFYSEVQLARNTNINRWFYESIRMNPTEGDLLLLLAKIN